MIHLKCGGTLQINTHKDKQQTNSVNFRKFRGEIDYPHMLAVINRNKGVDGMDRTDTLLNIKTNYEHLTNSDPYMDMVFAEVGGEVVGYGRGWWYEVDHGPLVYGFFAFLTPEYRENGTRQDMVEILENRLRELADQHNPQIDKYYETWATDREHAYIRLLEHLGYKVIRYGYDMLRPNLDNIPDHTLPEGLEIRSVQPDQYEIIWQAAVEAFRDHWNFSEDEWSLEKLKAWQKEQIFNPALWKVAWDGDQVAGMVLNFINEEENKEYLRKRGYTETICVRRPWRRRGLARALIAESLKLHHSLGMSETAHGVDAENPSGALQLYESMGYQVVKTGMSYRKIVNQSGSKQT